MINVPLWRSHSAPSCHYLASPYTHKHPAIRELRYITARDHTAKLLTDGLIIYSPIVHCHDLAKANDLPHDARFWAHYNNAMLALCTTIRVLMLPGWKESKGVAAELAEAKRLNLTQVYDEPGTEYVTELQKLAKSLHELYATQRGP